jgi:hypothetical protein
MAAEVGAIFLGSQASNYDLNTESGMFAGKIMQSGIALGEDGRVLLMQEVHLANLVPADPLTAITQSDGAGLETPLNFFQFNDPLIDLRDAQTRVSLSSNEAFNSEVSNIELSFSLDLSLASAGQQTFDRAKVALELSEWVAKAMTDFEPRAEKKETGAKLNELFAAPQAKSPAFESALSSLDLEAIKLESKLGAMRSMVESLREMRQHMLESNNKLSLYHTVERFKK